MRQEFEYDVFLSHSAKDKVVVRPLAERLRTCRAEAAGRRRKDGRRNDSQPSTLNPQPLGGSDRAQLEAGTFRSRALVNQERRSIPLRFDAPIKGGACKGTTASVAALGSAQT